MGAFWEHFKEIITDPAHTAVEFCFVLLDYLVIQVVVSRVRKHFHKDLSAEHARLDAEHGVKHTQGNRPTKGDPYDYERSGL